MKIAASELLLNADGSVYHLNLRPEHIAPVIIFVGDPDRVEKITRHFDTVELSVQKREFKTQTGTYNGRRISVISTGIGPDNIDIVLNELDALFNIDLKTRVPKERFTPLKIIRIGTSGSLQQEVPVGSFLASRYALDINGMLHAYRTESLRNVAVEDAFIAHTAWDENRARPLFIPSSHTLLDIFHSPEIHQGITATAGGFYGPQGRVLRLPLQNPSLNSKIRSFTFDSLKITNLEMETSAIYGLSQLLGHQAISLSAIIANRASGSFASDPDRVIAQLVTYVLEKIGEV
ncbi:nucleoside phosphorylase [Sinomicrobium sp.]